MVTEEKTVGVLRVEGQSVRVCCAQAGHWDRIALAQENESCQTDGRYCSHRCRGKRQSRA